VLEESHPQGTADGAVRAEMAYEDPERGHVDLAETCARDVQSVALVAYGMYL
jgi:hypothetical protein